MKESEDIVDKENMQLVLDEFPNQIKEGFKLGANIKIEQEISSIIITGMGGSALAGEFLKSYLNNFRIPIYVNKNYFLPEFIGPKTLLFASSYSGETEETINAYRAALRKGCKIVAISSGGRLETIAKKQNIPHIKIPDYPEGIQPRSTYGCIFFAILRVLQNSKIIEDVTLEMEKTVSVLKNPALKENAKELANKIYDRIPLIYSSERMFAAAYKWKIGFNEGAKIHAFCNVFPEMNHNEINAYVNIKGDYYVIMLKDEDDFVRIKKRMEITRDIIKNNHVPVTELDLKGNTFLTRLISASYIGDLTSYYLALKYGIDPTPTKLVQELKRRMG